MAHSCPPKATRTTSPYSKPSREKAFPYTSRITLPNCGIE